MIFGGSLRFGAIFVNSKGETINPVLISPEGMKRIHECGLTIMNDRFVGIVPDYLQWVRFKYTPSGLPYISQGVEELEDFFGEK